MLTPQTFILGAAAGANFIARHTTTAAAAQAARANTAGAAEGSTVHRGSAARYFFGEAGTPRVAEASSAKHAPVMDAGPGGMARHAVRAPHTRGRGLAL